MIELKKIMSILLIVIMSFVTLGCSNKEKEVIQTSMIYPDGLPAIALSKFITDNSMESLKIDYQKQNTPDALLGELIKGQSDLAVVPSNLALKVAEKGLDYKILGTVGWGSFYLVTTESINDLNEIKDYEIYNTGKGLTPDIVTRKILQYKGFSDDSINYTYVGAASELAPLIISGKAKVAVVPEPILSTIKSKNINLNILLDLNKEWCENNKTQMGYPQSTLLMKTDLYNKLKDNGELQVLIDKLENDIDWVNNNPDEVSQICDTLDIKVNKEVLPEALKNSNLKFKSIDDSKKEYQIYFDAIGGNKETYKKLF